MQPALNDIRSNAGPLAGTRHPLDAVFAPRSVAVIGASNKPGSVGRTLLQNLLQGGFDPGRVYAVNPKHASVQGHRAYPDIRSVPGPVDLAVIATPARVVPGVIEQCAAAGVRGAVVVSAGFRECGPEGAELERRVLALARASGMRVVGPNCLGVAAPAVGLNATFARARPPAGNIGFLSQSGALGSAIFDWAARKHVGFSAFASVGSMLDVGWGDLIDYLGDDPATKAIAIYMESIGPGGPGDARSFLSAAREVALTKPIVVIKAGRTPAGGRAAASHTGALTGSDEVISAALHRAGVLRVETIEELFDMVELVGRQPRPAGPRLAIVTNAGGPGVLAADAVLSSGGRLAELDAETTAALSAMLPAHWSRGNPVDVLGDADADRFARAAGLVVADAGVDGVLAVYTPQGTHDPAEAARALAAVAPKLGKPLLASWIGGATVDAARRTLAESGVPAFDYPDTAARAFEYLWQYSSNLRGLYETPTLPALDSEERRPRAAAIIDAARSAGHALLTEHESKRVLEAYGIPCVPTRLAATEAEAIAAAGEVGYPVVLKVNSRMVVHKGAAGGVELNLGDADQVGRAYRSIRERVEAAAGPGAFEGVTVQPMVRRRGFELILGSSIDPQFGPVLLFGLGGSLVEVFRDRALGLPPLTATLARRMVEQTKVYGALAAAGAGGAGGASAVDLGRLDEVLVRLSHLVVEQPAIREIDVNPLLASGEGVLALDARILLHDRSIPDERLPRTAIRPYPTRYVSQLTLADGTGLTVRPIRPEDESLMVEFHRGLSERTVHFRYAALLKLGRRVSHDRLARVCFADYDREIPLVAERIADPATGRREILAVARLSRTPGTDRAEFALVVADAWQNRRLGSRLMELLVGVARAEGVAHLFGQVLAENFAMRRVCEKLGFHTQSADTDGDSIVELDLVNSGARR